MDVYSDIFQLGYGFIQTEGEPSGEHKANPIIVGSFGGHYDEDGKLEGDRVRRRILFEDTFEDTLAEFSDANWAITNGLTYWGRANTADAQSKMCALISTSTVRMTLLCGTSFTTAAAITPTIPIRTTSS